jgi:ABC-2 type transport system permease protein
MGKVSFNQNFTHRRSTIQFSMMRAIFLLSIRIFVLRYRSDKLSFLWSVLEPATLSLAYWFLISQVSRGSLGIEPYYLFVASGILPWLWFSNSIKDAQSMFRSYGKLMSSLGLPRLLWPIPIILSRLADYLFGLSILLLLPSLVLEFRISFVWIVAAIAAQFTLTLSLIYILSPIITLIPDFARLVTVCLRIGFFLTPILYLSINVPNYFELFLKLNPLTPIFDMYRQGLFGSQVSNETLGWLTVSIGLLLGIGLILNHLVRKITLKAIL